MAQTIKENIIRTSDGECCRALIDIAKDEAGTAAAHLKISFAIGGEKSISRNQFDTDEELASFLKSQGRTFRNLRLINGSGHDIVTVTRNFEGTRDSLYDVLTLSPGEPQHSPLEPAAFSKLAEVTQERFRIAVSKDIIGLLGPDVAEHFRAREEALSRLEAIIDRNLASIDEKRSELDKRHEERQTELEAAYQQRQQDLEARITDKENTLNSKADELAARAKTLDDRTNTHVRRDIREKLLDAIKDADRFKLTTQTIGRRRWVFWAYVALLLCFLVPAAFLFYKQYQSDTIDPWVFGQKIAFTLGFVVSAGFFLRWLNSFAAKSADEEFKMKQLQLDIDRASWLVELYFESIAAGDKSGMPAELLNRLSTNLFLAEEGKHESMTAADALASALFSSAGKARLRIPGIGYVELDKQGIRKLARKQVKAE